MLFICHNMNSIIGVMNNMKIQSNLHLHVHFKENQEMYRCFVVAECLTCTLKLPITPLNKG